MASPGSGEAVPADPLHPHRMMDGGCRFGSVAALRAWAGVVVTTDVAAAGAAPDPLAVIRSPRYLALLAIAALVGAPIAAIAYFLLKLIGLTQQWAYTDLPSEVGFSAVPPWWPLIPLGVAGVVVGLIVRFLPGHGGEIPVEGFKAGGTPSMGALPGIVLGAAGIGALIFTGLDSLTGFGVFSLAIPNVPAVGAPTVAEFGYAIALGVLAAGLAFATRRLASLFVAVVSRSLVIVTTAVGLASAALAIGYHAATNHATSDVLFSGQTALPSLVDHAAGYSAGALALLIVCKWAAYTGALASFRGGPTFPAMFLGAAGGV